MSKQTFDAVSLGIMWDRLVALVDEIVSTLVRTSFSTIVNESYDLTCVLLDEEANSIAQGTFSVPVFIGSAPVTLRRMPAQWHRALPRPRRTPSASLAAARFRAVAATCRIGRVR